MNGSTQTTAHPLIADALDPYLPLQHLADYSGISVRSLRRALTDRLHPLPHYRLSTKKILVRRSEFDRWIQRFREVPAQVDLDRLIEDTLRPLRP